MTAQAKMTKIARTNVPGEPTSIEAFVANFLKMSFIFSSFLRSIIQI